MTLVMTRPTTQRKKPGRLYFIGQLFGAQPSGELLDIDFDNDNEKPVTAEPLDYLLQRK